MYSKDRQSSIQKFETISQILFIQKILENCHLSKLLKIFPPLKILHSQINYCYTDNITVFLH